MARAVTVTSRKSVRRQAADSTRLDNFFSAVIWSVALVENVMGDRASKANTK